MKLVSQFRLPSPNYLGNFAGDVCATCAPTDRDVHWAFGTDCCASVSFGLIDESKPLQQPIFRRLKEVYGVHCVYRSAWDLRTLRWVGTPSWIVVASLADLGLDLGVKLRAHENGVEGSMGEHLLSKMGVISALDGQAGRRVDKFPFAGGHDVKHSQFHSADTEH